MAVPERGSALATRLRPPPDEPFVSVRPSGAVVQVGQLRLAPPKGDA